MTLSANQLTEWLVAQATPHLKQALDEVGEQLASSIAAQAPYRTGALRTSIVFTSTGPLSGALQMQHYALPIERGHSVRQFGGTRRARSYRYRTIGYVFPNPFITRGVAGAPLSSSWLSAGQLDALRVRVLEALAALS